MSKYFGFGDQKTTSNGSGEMNRSWTSSYNENCPQDSSYKTWTGSGNQGSSHSQHTYNAWPGAAKQQNTFNDSNSNWSSTDFTKNSLSSSWLSSDSTRSRSASSSSSESSSDSSKSISSSGSLFNNNSPDADCRRRLLIQGWANGTF